jgi:hypothetical protein
VQQFYADGGGSAGGWIWVTAGSGHLQAESRAYARATWKYCVVNGSTKASGAVLLRDTLQG